MPKDYAVAIFMIAAQKTQPSANANTSHKIKVDLCIRSWSRRLPCRPLVVTGAHGYLGRLRR